MKIMRLPVIREEMLRWAELWALFGIGRFGLTLLYTLTCTGRRLAGPAWIYMADFRPLLSIAATAALIQSFDISSHFIMGCNDLHTGLATSPTNGVTMSFQISYFHPRRPGLHCATDWYRPTWAFWLHLGEVSFRLPFITLCQLQLIVAFFAWDPVVCASQPAHRLQWPIFFRR